MKRNAAAAAAVALAISWAAATAPAAGNLLRALPEKTLAFVQVNRLAATDARLAGLANRAHWPLPSLLALFKTQAGVKEGLDEQGAAAMVLVGEDVFDEPPVVLFVPVTDYDKFLAPVKRGESQPGIARVQVWNAPFLVKRAGAHAVFAEPRHEMVLEEDLAPGGLDRQLAPLAPYLEENDLSAAVTRHGIHLLARIVKEHSRRLKELAIGAGGTAGLPAKTLDLYERFFESVDGQAAAIAAGLRLDKQGALRLSARLSLVASAGAAATLAKLAPGKQDPLAGLPGGPFVFAAGANWPPPLSAAVLGPYRELLQAFGGAFDIPPDQRDQFVNLSCDLIRAVHGQSILLRPGKGTPAYRDMTVVIRVDSAAMFLAGYEKQMRACAQAAQGTLNKAAMGMAVRRTGIRGKPALEVSFQLPPVGMAEAQQMIDKLLGPGGKINVYLVAVDERTVVASYVSKDLVGATIDALADPQQGLSADPLVARTRSMLPRDARAVGYWSPGGTVTLVNRVLKIFAGLPGVPESVPDFPPTPPVGFAARIAPAELQAELVLPAEFIHALAPYRLKLMAAFQGGG